MAIITTGKLTQSIQTILKSPMFKTLTIFASANMISSALQGVGGIIQARWISPATLGEFTKYGILTSYLALFLVPVQDGLARQFPYLIGKGDKDAAVRVAATAKSWYVVIAVAASLLFAALAARALVAGDLRAAVGWGFQIVASVAMSYDVYLQTIYRRSMEFKRLSYNGLISGVIGFASLVCVKFWGYFGLALKVFLLNVSRIALDAKHVPMKIGLRWDLRQILSLAKISVPLSVEGYIRTSFMTATFGFLVVRYCGERDLGLYGIAMAFESFAMLFVTSMMQIFDVKMTSKYGETDSLSQGARALMLPSLLGILCAFVLAGALCLVIGPFIRFFVPNYTGAIPVVYVLSLSLPLGVAFMPTRLLRVALLYKSIYAVALTRIVVLIVSALVVPKTIIWFAGCKVFSELVSILIGLLLLWMAIKRERSAVS